MQESDSTRPSAPGRGGLVVLDAEPLFAAGIRVLLAHTGALDWAGAASNLPAGASLIQRVRPAVLLLDARLDPHLDLLAETAATPTGPAVVLVIPPGRAPIALATRNLGPQPYATCARTAPARILTAGIKAALGQGHYHDRALTPQPPRQLRAGLSPREWATLREAALGYGNATIAAHLGVGTETVRTHMRGLLRKLDARDRAHAVAQAYRRGLLTPTDLPEEHPDQDEAPSPTRARTRR